MGETTNYASNLDYQIFHNTGDPEDDFFAKKIDTNYVYGILLVKDWASNIHHRQCIPSTPGQHAEAEMLEALHNLYGETGILFPAKIIFYLSKSPCRACTDALPQWIAEVMPALAKVYPLYFSFVFNQYYLNMSGSAQSNRNMANVWDSPWEAYTAYSEAEKAATVLTAPLGLKGVLNIRQIGQTKGGDDSSRRKISFSYDTRLTPWGGERGEGVRIGYGLP